jgi:hypothetical protein
MSTRAARMGRDQGAVDRAIDSLRIRTVLPPELARAMQAQERDMVVAVLRGNEKGSTSRARAAAQELRAELARRGWTPEQMSDEQLQQVLDRFQTAGENDGREYRAGRGDGGGAGGKYAPLDGATKARGWHGPVRELVDAADEYARRAGIDLKRQAYFITKERFDEEFARRIADAYEAMEHAPNDPAVRAAYEAMIAETRAQYDVLVEFGYSFTFFGNDDDPYEGNPFNAMRDLRDNKTMAVYSTIAGHGSGYSDAAVDDNPLLADTGLEWPGQDGTPIKVLANDLFRAVHDAFGHGLEGAGFRYDGEENAWQAHARLFSVAALPALTSETRGQNSWLNFGPKGEGNRFAVLDDTTFADQKAGLLPSWAWTENVVPDMERDYEQDAAERLGQRGDVSGIGDVGVDARPSYPRLDRPPVNEDGTVTLDHFTDQEGLTETDPSAWGRSGKFLPDSERRRIGAAPGRTYFGIATQRGGYVNEFGSGKHPRTQKPIRRVTARIPFDRLYDMYGDPDGLKAVGRALPKDAQGRYIYKDKPIDGVSLYERLIQDAGYAGYWTPALGLTAAVFEPVEVVPYEAERDDYQGRELFQAARTNTIRNFAEQLDAEHIAKHGGPLSPLENPEHFEIVKQGMLDAYREMVDSEDDGSNWYGSDIADALEATQAIIPELTDPTKRDVMLTLAAVLSPQRKPTQNWEEAVQAMQLYLRTGRMPTTKENGKAFGLPSTTTSLQLLDYLIQTKGEQEAMAWLAEPHNGREVAELRRDSGLFGQKKGLLDYKASEFTYADVKQGYYIFGPKVGAFSMNVLGLDANAVTVDIWASRTYNRLAGRLISDAQESSKSGVAEAPTSARGRGVIQRMMTEIAAEVGSTPSAVQAALWYYEQGLYRENGIPAESTAFAGAAQAALARRGLGGNAATRGFNQDARDQVARQFEQATIFYSALERAAEAVKTERAPAQQWIATLKNAPGVKAEELDATGVIDWLNTLSGQVDKAQVIDVLRRGGITVQEIILTGEPTMEVGEVLEVYEDEIWERVSELANEEFEDDFAGNVIETVREDLLDIDRQTPDLFDPEIGPPYQSPPAITYSANFSMRYTDLDGDRMERYMDDFDYEFVEGIVGESGDFVDLGTFPSREAAQAALDKAKEDLRRYLFEYEQYEDVARESAETEFIERYANGGGDNTKFREYSWSASDVGDPASYTELLINLPLGVGGNPERGFNGNHWREPSNLLHIRFSEVEGPQGQRQFFVQEMQTDIHKIAADRFKAVKNEQVERFLSLARVGELEGAVDTEVYQAANDQVRDDPKQAHRVWPQVASWLKENGGQIGDAMIQAVEDANEGYASEPSPEKVAQAEANLAAANENLEAVSEAHTKALAELQAAAIPFVDAWDAEYAERIEKERAKLKEIETEYANAEGQRFYELRPLVREQQGVVDRLAADASRLSLAVRRSPDTLNFRDIMFAFDRAGMEEQLDEFKASDAYIRAFAAENRWQSAITLSNLRTQELDLARNGGGGIPMFPFKKTWIDLALKRVVHWAAAEGFDEVVWINGDQVNGGKLGEDFTWLYGQIVPNTVKQLFKKYGVKVEPKRVPKMPRVQTSRMNEVEERLAEIDVMTEGVASLMRGIASGQQVDELSFRLGQVEGIVSRGEKDLAERNAKIAEERAKIDAGESESDYIYEAYERETAVKEEELARARAAVDLLSNTEEALRVLDEYEALWSELADLRETAPTNLGFDITPELREAAASGFPLFQPDHRNMPRGRILFPGNDDQGAVVELFQGRDLSTLLHESSHLWLEELKADAADPNAPEQIKRDWQIVLDWFKANGHEVKSGIIPVGAHEMWARGGERYMREGKAPSVGLKRAFETFRSWLVNLYKSVRGLNAPITPEIREVFDRLLATDEEIAEARQVQGMEALFNTAMEAGMSADEFANYQEQVESARAEAQGRVLEKAMADIAKRETRLGRERRREIKDKVTEGIEQTPLFRALSILKEERMSRAALEARFGADIIGQLPSRVPPIYANEGADPEIIAERAGFPDVQAMIDAMVQAEAEQQAAKAGGDKRGMKARMIDQMTDQAFAMQYGEAMTPDQIRQEALDAVANDRQGEVIASEIAALARKTRKPPTPYQVARQWARSRVRQGLYVTEASKSALERHRRAIAAAGREAEQAMLAGDMEAVYRAKQKQMLSSALLSEAKAAHEEVEVARARMERIAKARTMKSVDQDYLEQAHALLEEVDLKQRSQTSINEKLGFDEWLATRGDGEEVFVPDRLNWKGQPWSRLTVEQIMGLDDTIKSIIHLGGVKQAMLDNKERREFEAWRDEARAGLEDTPGRKIDEAKLNEEKRKLASIFSNLAKMEVVAKEMDNDKVGPWTRLLTWRASDAANYRDEMRDRVLKPIAAAYNALDNKARKRLAETVQAPGLLWKSPDINDPRNGTPIKLTRWNVLAMALNMGNQSSLEKLARGYGISVEYAEAIAMENLNEQEWAFVQSVWDSLELLWPDIAKVEREMSGVAPERVEVRPIRTPFGELRGGYYPVVYDPASSQKAEDNLNDATADLFGKRSGVATASGHTKARTGYAAPILLSPESVIFQHVEKVITRNAYAPWVRDVLRAIKEPSLRAMIDRKMGPELRQMIEPWLRQQVREGATNEAMTGVEAFLRSARVNVTVVSMGLRWSTGVAQTIGLANSIARVGLTGMQRGIRKMLQNPAAAQEFVFSRSPEMARRNEAMNRDVAEAFRVMRMQARGGGPIKRTLKDWQSKAQTMAFWHIGMIDRWIVSMPTWLGAYENAIRAGATDEEATRAGDSAVRLSQGSGVEKDLSAWQSNQSSEALKFLTMFYTPFNVLLNAQWEATRSARRGDWRKASMITFWMLIATPLFDALLAGDVPDDDDEEGWGSWLVRNIGTYQMAGIPILRDVANYAERKFIGEYASFNPGPLTRIFSASEKATQLAWDGTLGEDEISETWLRTAIETPGFFLGLPTGQVSQTSQFLYDVKQGTQNPRDFSDWYQGLTKGKIKED